MVFYVFIVFIFLVVILVVGSKVVVIFKLDDFFYEVDFLERYGLWIIICLYFVRFLMFLMLLLLIFNFFGFVLYNLYFGVLEFKGVCVNGFLICFRVVMKGMCLDLVKRNVERNINICNGFGLSNFMFEVVIDRFIGFLRSLLVREIVVLFNYRMVKKMLFKVWVF